MTKPKMSLRMKAFRYLVQAGNLKRCRTFREQGSSESAMHTQIVMDRSGDTRHEFDPASSKEVVDAERRFRQLTGEGFRAVALGRDGEPGRLLADFDSTVERTLFIPQLQGG